MAHEVSQTPGQQSSSEFKPYISADTDLKEFSLKAILVGIVMALILGSANAYVGMKAGMTVAATFPAAVVAIAIFRIPIFYGTILEQNIARTTASVGEALVAGAIFTIPAFILAGVWKDFKYIDSTIIMLVGGILGVLFIIILRRTLVQEADLPFPESVACAEIVKAGQKGETGASYVFGAMGFASILEFIKNSRGYQLFSDRASHFFDFGKFFLPLRSKGQQIGEAIYSNWGSFLEAPLASPAIMGVGYVIGPRLAAVTFSGGVFAWLMLIPLLIFINIKLGIYAESMGWEVISSAIWADQVRPIAVGAMIVGAFYTLYGLRKPLITGLNRAFKELGKKEGTHSVSPSRLDIDIPFKWVLLGVIFLLIPISLIYYYFSGKVGGAIVAALVMTFAGFLFAAVAGYLVGIIGSSSNPISGLTLSTLIIAALLMFAIGIKGTPGILAVLGVAAVVCVVAGVAGDMMQDLKVGHILGGTPWKMQVGEMFGVIASALFLVFPIMWLHKAYGIGSRDLPAPQAGLMAMLAQGIMVGKMAWPLVVVGMMFSLGLIMIKSPSPMLIAVGMYLPFETTAAIFLGGIIRFVINRIMKLRKFSDVESERISNKGILVASGLIAGEAITGILLALLVIMKVDLPSIYTRFWPSFFVYAIVAYLLISIPLRREKPQLAS